GRASPGAHDVLTSDQMIAANARSAYEAVQKLRPDWFSTRGPTAITNVEPDVASVYLGGNHIGDIEALRNIRPDDVKQLRYYEAGEASARFGMGHSRGVIDVVLKGSDGAA
ncbi:MAG: hypothetical protein ACREK1_06405, partial [Longimicrobiales bacterium]